VVKLQSSKKEIASDLIQTDESILKSLSKEELIDLF
jgi:SNF2 family DNA or RNA helicase